MYKAKYNFYLSQCGTKRRNLCVFPVLRILFFFLDKYLILRVLFLAKYLKRAQKKGSEGGQYSPISSLFLIQCFRQFSNNLINSLFGSVKSKTISVETRVFSKITLLWHNSKNRTLVNYMWGTNLPTDQSRLILLSYIFVSKIKYMRL